ncbi:D-beta-hydroxybutyrate dehydrogenase, mitochondrial [Callorhinchus milii]|uniref:3-hydroxybutyrate dehydrogenase, type 1 n=1 Tax=Callorhinchus milii TaxID=7868 RepID=V9KH40_CALMI|nr:D-beta-hydroxybutyrate dehydrogenase, mitochondrial [Callorhinchus milii]|eukprot:gi/632933992/ref/XP_007895635.1/ PREDICTED: D-beta-hydroxybutyrate dehydrogenase, mitochondrial-like [Callorhinchus milii]
MSRVSHPQMVLLVLFSMGLTLSLGFWLPELLSWAVKLLGFTDETVTHSIVLMYLLFVLCVAMPSLPRGSVKVEHKAVFITGCDTGFGFALAKHLHAQGFIVFAGCLLKDKNGEGAQVLENMKCDRMNVLQLNVCSDEDVAQAVESVKSHLKENEKGLWGVVNIAGDSSFGEVEFTGMERYKELADVNLWGTIRVTKAFLPLIRKATGRVVNISSMFGCMGQAGQSSYCISKYGVEAFSDCLRYELQHWGVKVSIIEPGNYSFLTREHIGSTADTIWKESSDSVREDYGKSHFDRRTMAMKSQCSNGSKDISPVINAMADALTSKYPYRRYRPMDTYWWIRLQILTHLPDAIADMMYKY